MQQQPGTSLGASSYADNQSNAAGAGSLATTVTLDPGAVFWVRVLLQTPAPNGSTVSSATLTTAWDDDSQLAPMWNIAPPPVVPEPGTALMLGLGLAGMAGLRLRRRRAA